MLLKKLRFETWQGSIYDDYVIEGFQRFGQSQNLLLLELKR